jgi:hypothetical protein
MGNISAKCGKIAMSTMKPIKPRIYLLGGSPEFIEEI